jgi:hypothetical protein
MKCREPTKLHRKSGLVAGMEPKSAFIAPLNLELSTNLASPEKPGAERLRQDARGCDPYSEGAKQSPQT